MKFLNIFKNKIVLWTTIVASVLIVAISLVFIFKACDKGTPDGTPFMQDNKVWVVEDDEKVLYTGIYNGKYIKNGVYGTGTYENVYYENGLPHSGIGKDGKYYQNGALSSGSYAGKIYKDGVAFTGKYTDDKWYTNGSLQVSGYVTEDGKVYKIENGVASLYTGDYDGKYYENGDLFTGKKLIENVLYDIVAGVKNLYTGSHDDKYYIDGVESPISFKFVNGWLYKVDGTVETLYTGIYDDEYYEEGLPFTGKKLISGVLYDIESGVRTLYSGLYEGKYYEDGLLFSGKKEISGILFDIVDGVMTEFTGDYENKYYENGSLFTGKKFFDGKLYDIVNGVKSLFTGEYNGKDYVDGVTEDQGFDTGVNPEDGKYYENGNLFTGKKVIDGVLYDIVEGEMTAYTGTYDVDNKYYVDGYLANGEYDNKVYENGELFTGKKVIEDVLYDIVAGVKTAYTGDHENKYYEDGTLFTGKKVIENVLYDVVAGVKTAYTGDHENKYYENGTLFDGVKKLDDNKVYQITAGEKALFTGIFTADDKYYKEGVLGTGEYENKVYENGDLFTGKKLIENVLYDIVAGVKTAYTGDHENKYYEDGTLFTGKKVIEGVLYDVVSGVKTAFTGDHENKYYEDGALYTGTKKLNDNKVYQITSGEKALFTGIFTEDNKYYANGVLGTGEYQNKYYEAGNLFTGKKIIEGVLYDVVSGVKTAFTGDHENKYYEDGTLFTGKKVIENVLYDVVSGVKTAYTGEYNGDYYTDGVVASGISFVEEEGLLYKIENGNKEIYTGEYQDKYYENGTLFTGKKVVDDILCDFDAGVKTPFTGIYDADDKYYENGVLGTGEYENKVYENGDLFTGKKEIDGILYDVVVGVKTAFTGEHENLVYENGELFTGIKEIDGTLYEVFYGEKSEYTGEYDGKYYEFGYPYDGMMTEGGILYEYVAGVKEAYTGNYKTKYYVDGVKANGKYNELYYEEGDLYTGYKVVEDVLYDIVNGSMTAYTGIYTPENKYYENGTLFTGLKELSGKVYSVDAGEMALYTGLFGNKYYEAGDLGTGEYQNKYYENGNLFNGKKFFDGVLYNVAEGVKTLYTGDYNDKYYVDGAIADGIVHEGKYYEDGALYTGKKVVDGVLYDISNGTMTAFTGTHSDNKYYKNGVLFSGKETIDGVLYNVVEGVKTAFTGDYNEKYYENGTLFTGKKLLDGKLYDINAGVKQLFTGEYDNKYYENGNPYTGTHDGKYYVDGALANGEIDGSVYSNGVLYTGPFKASDSKVYNVANGVKGELYTGVYNDLVYTSGLLHTGPFLFNDDNLVYNVTDGVKGALYTGIYNGSQYTNGALDTSAGTEMWEENFQGTVNIKNLALEPDAGFTIDGDLSEPEYANQKWLSYDYAGMTIETTAVMGQKGFYVAMKVTDSQIYALDSRQVWMGSSVEFYCDRADSTAKSATTFQYRLSAINVVEILKGIETVEDRWKWTYLPIHGMTKVDGVINSGNTVGMDAEIFVRWDALGYDYTASNFVAPTQVKLFPVYNQSSGPDTDSPRAYWAYNGGEIHDPTDYWLFDSTGWVGGDATGAVIGDSAFGRAKTPGWDITNERNSTPSVSTTLLREQQIYFTNTYTDTYMFTTLVKRDSTAGTGNELAGVILGGAGRLQEFMIDFTSSHLTASTAQGKTLNKGNPEPHPNTLWDLSSGISLASANIDPTQAIRITGVKVGKYFMIFVGDANTAKYGGTLIKIYDDPLLTDSAAPGFCTVNCRATFSDYAITTDSAQISAVTGEHFSMLTLNNATGSALSSVSTGYEMGTTAIVEVRTNPRYQLTQLVVKKGSVTTDVTNQIVDGQLSIVMDSAEVIVESTCTHLASGSFGAITATVTQSAGTLIPENISGVAMSPSLGTYARITVTDNSSVTAGTGKFKVQQLPYGTYDLLFYISGKVALRQTGVVVESATVDLGNLELKFDDGILTDLPAGGSNDPEAGTITLAAKTNYEMYTFGSGVGFEVGLTLKRTDGTFGQGGTWNTGGVIVVAGGNKYRIFVMCEDIVNGSGDIVVYLVNETSWAQAEYRLGGKTWGTGAPITFDLAFLNGQVRLLVNRSVQYNLTKTNASSYGSSTAVTVPAALNYFFDDTGARTVGIVAIDTEIIFSNYYAQEITAFPTKYTNKASTFTDNNETALHDSSTGQFGLGGGNVKWFPTTAGGTSPVQTAGTYMVEMTAYRADGHNQEGSWDTYGLVISVNSVEYRLFFMRESQDKTVIYLTGKETKEYRVKQNLSGTGERMSLKFIYNAATSKIHILWGALHIELNSSSLNGTTNTDPFSNSLTKQIGVFANVSTVFEVCSYSSDMTLINDTLNTAGTALTLYNASDFA